MKSLLLSTTLCLMSLCATAQEKVTLKAGTMIPLQAEQEVRGAKANVGQKVDFSVCRDIIVDGKVAISQGTIAHGTVYEAKRSTAFGTRGRLGIKIRSLTTGNGDYVGLTGSDVYIKGQNRTAVSVIVFLCTWLPFPCGGKAVMQYGYETDATVASNTEITL